MDVMQASVGTYRAEQFRAARSGSSSAIITKNLGDVLSDLERVCDMIANDAQSPLLAHLIASLHFNMKLMGQQMESVYKDVMDRRFVQLRDGCRDRRLASGSRLRLLELVELRALPLAWIGASPGQLQYYRRALQVSQTMSANQPLYHAPGESSTVNAPLLSHHSSVSSQNVSNGITRHAVTNRAQRQQHKHRLEVVIRNADSGKVMGVKGLRVHKIEELSSTVISFQRVPSGAKERVVQISGPEEVNVLRARGLIESVIRRNASPSRDDVRQVELLLPNAGGPTVPHTVASAPSPSNSSTCSSSCGSHSFGDAFNSGTSETVNLLTSDEAQWRRNGGLADSRSLHITAPFPSQIPSACLGQYRYTVTVGDQAIRVVGPHANLVKTAKLVLDEYFGVVCSLQQSLCDGNSSRQQARAEEKSADVVNRRDAATGSDSNAAVSSDSSHPTDGAGDCTQAGIASADQSVISLHCDRDPAQFSAPSKEVAAVTVTASGDVGTAAASNPMAGSSEASVTTITQYGRSTLLMYARSVVARYPPVNWQRARQLVPRVARNSSRDWDIEAFATRGGKGDLLSDGRSVVKCEQSANQSGSTVN